MNIVSAAHYLNNGYKVYRMAVKEDIFINWKIVLVLGKYANRPYHYAIYQQLDGGGYVEREFRIDDMLADDWEIYYE